MRGKSKQTLKSLNIEPRISRSESRTLVNWATTAPSQDVFNGLNCPRHAKKVSTKVILWKNGFKKQLIFEKEEHFENGQKWPQCKGYSPCKILSLGQKIKQPKTCEKRFWKHHKVVLCKKRLQKTANIRKMRAFWKWAKMATMQRL